MTTPTDERPTDYAADTGPQAPRATWKLSGTLQVSVEDTSDAAAGPHAPAA